MSEQDIRSDGSDGTENEFKLTNVYDPINGFGKLCPDCGRRFGDGAFIYHQCGERKPSIMEEISKAAVRNHKFWR